MAKFVRPAVDAGGLATATGGCMMYGHKKRSLVFAASSELHLTS